MTTSDLELIQATVTNVAHFIDARRWPKLRALFADVVELDYTSLFGGPVQQQLADDMMKAWRNLLTPLITQHFLGPITAQISASNATAECHVRAYNQRKGATAEWIVAGHYTFALSKVGPAWKIDKMKLDTFFQSGTLKAVQEGP
jgi:hypothetical protein